ncbi:hypothetical protein CPI83_30425 (plasmid) [Rhodococcus sp. H-CA8f]|uniref:SMI1/KNR4 family protein n=1 Tax=Rhodococcus qingshengii TaxID=334542 RepID=A0AAW6LVH7_RHOSG|nr:MULTISPECIES: hypothetical protein [Rhodococcus]ATI36511.1 hypothetical protein CPI83_30425 [Rhodococcus sp. H-CA8f]MDE8648960.1 hypothetical protein [Rhodococcus qingshengii]
MTTSITDVLNAYFSGQQTHISTHPRQPVGDATLFDPPCEIPGIAENWDLDALPDDLLNLWTSTAECRLHHDNGLRRESITLLSPSASKALTARELMFWGIDDRRLAKDDIIFGTLLVEPELLVFDPTRDEYTILLASMLEERKDWPVVGRNLADFLLRYRHSSSQNPWRASVVKPNSPRIGC